MDVKKQKLALKDIRDAIKNGNNSLAIEKCQELLNEDPQNYMGLVLMGAAYQNSDKAQAAYYLRKAVSNSSTPTVALQGLANCAKPEELPDIYEQLLTLVPEKYNEYFEKLADLGLSNPKLSDKCIEILRKEALQADTSNRKQSSHLNLAKIWITRNDINDTDLKLFRSCLEIAITDESNSELQLKSFKRFLKYLYKQADYEKLIITADSMFNLYPDDLYSLEWICTAYYENCETNPEVLSVLPMPIEFYSQKLEELTSNSGLVLIIKAISALKDEQVLVARNLLYNAQQILQGNKAIMRWLARVELLIGAYATTLSFLKMLGIQDEDYGMCLSHSQDPVELREAISVLSTLEQTEVVIDSLARCYLALGEKDKLNDFPLSPFLQAKYKLSHEEALQALDSLENQESYEVLLLRGTLNLACQNYDSALTCILKSTRLKPYRAECFLHLGEIYMALEDAIRARKCLEKCVNLDAVCVKAVSLLSAIYQEAGDEDVNEALLLSTLQKIPMASSKWTHFKLGLHYLEVDKFDDAIQSFRRSLKLDPTCLVSWECLGDAYCERGSYNSALRVFQKVLEFDPNNVYAKLQMALIKKTVRMYPEAIESFDSLLAEHPDYLPALKGAAESHVGQAGNLKKEKRLSRSKYHLQCAMKYLERAFVVGKKDMIWLWRLTATTFVQVALLPNSKAHLEVSGKLANQPDSGTITLDRNQLLTLAGRFYTCALKLLQNTYLWYELSLCAYYNAKFDPKEEAKHLDLAIQCCKSAIKEQSDRWQNWNLLGVLNAHTAIHDLPFAQHCFIQALHLERKSYVSWTNLGVLYLQLSDIKLANQAFQRAQQSSPIYPNAWIGQAMIAEHIADEEEALDLFRHCQQFDFHLESTIGYAYMVCNILCDEKKRTEPRFKRTIDLMFADVVALDAINWYVNMEEDKCSGEALSYQGFLNARQCLWRPAITSYLQAVESVSSEDKNKLYTNLGYMFLKNNQPKEAITAFNSVSEASFKPIVGLALALYRSGQHQESYSVYSSILKSVAKSDDAKAALILVAMASMVYASQGEADTRIILYQCILLKDSPIQALFSACALGILHKDNQLTETILEELKKYERCLEHCAHIAFLTSQYYLANNQSRKGFTYLISRVHMYPQSPDLRKVLANYLLNNYGHLTKYFVAISQVALSAIVLGHRSTKKNSSVEDAKSFMTASRALRVIDAKRSRKLIQQAIHLYPQSREAWTALAVSA